MVEKAEIPDDLKKTPLSLKERYDKLFEYASRQEAFVWVFRAEGSLEWAKDGFRSSGNTHLIGSWYTPRYEAALGHKKDIEEDSGQPVKVYALLIPQSVLDGRSSIDKGMDQVNVLNTNLREGRIEIEDKENLPSPTLETYLNQFAFVREYKELEGLQAKTRDESLKQIE